MSKIDELYKSSASNGTTPPTAPETPSDATPAADETPQGATGDAGETPDTYDPYAPWEALTLEQQLHEILTLFPLSDWPHEPALSVLAQFRHDSIHWAQIVLTWRARDRFAKLRLLEDAMAAWWPELGVDPASVRPATR